MTGNIFIRSQLTGVFILMRNAKKGYIAMRRRSNKIDSNECYTIVVMTSQGK